MKMKAKQHYPTKKKLNLVIKEKSPFRLTRLLPGLLLVFLVLALFSKLFVLGRLEAIEAARNELQTLEGRRDLLLEETVGYPELQEEYIHNSIAWMTEDLKNTPSCGEILDLVEQQLVPTGDVLTLSSSGKLLSVQLNKVDLEIVSQLVETLNGLPQVEQVQIYTAQSENPTGKQANVSLVITLVPVPEGEVQP